ncbi:MAG: hypothetical protein II846_06190 [Acetobacter sp.]|nr:hypothetical protein [Acetobacter sp.]
MNKLILYVLAGLGVLFVVAFLLITLLYLGARFLIFVFPFILGAVALCTVYGMYAIGKVFSSGDLKVKKLKIKK